MRIHEAARYLSDRGYQCAAGTVRALVRSGLLKCWRGPTDRGPMQFPEAELDRFLREGLTAGKKPARRSPLSDGQPPAKPKRRRDPDGPGSTPELMERYERERRA